MEGEREGRRGAGEREGGKRVEWERKMERTGERTSETEEQEGATERWEEREQTDGKTERQTENGEARDRSREGISEWKRGWKGAVSA